MKLTINRSLVNQVYGEIKSITSVLASVIGGANPQGPRLEVPDLPETLTTGLEIKNKAFTIIVSEDTIDIEIMDEFVLDYMRLYSGAIPLFAPVVASAVISAKMMAANVVAFTNKWSDSVGTVDNVYKPVASEHKIVSTHDIGVFDDYGSSVAIKVVEVEDTAVVCIQAIKSFGVKNFFVNRREFCAFVTDSMDMMTESQGTTLIKERNKNYILRASTGTNVEEITLRPRHVSTILSVVGLNSAELLERLQQEEAVLNA